MTAVIQDIIAAYRHQYGAEIVSRTHRMPGQPGQSVSHLSVSQAVAHAWLDMTGEPFRPHHATTLMAMRRKEHVALVAQNPRRTLSLIALVVHGVLEEPQRPALFVVIDEAAALDVYRQMMDFVGRLPEPHDIVPTIVSDITGSAESSSILIVTYDALHRRMLRHFDRGWRAMWESLGLVALLDIHLLAGIGMAHMAAMLVRMQRVLTQYDNINELQLIATTIPAEGIDAVLRHLQVGNWRHIQADDYGYEPVDVEIWHVPEDFVMVGIQLAQQLSDAGYRTHVCMNPPLQLLWADHDTPELMTTAYRLWPADVLVVAGVGDQRNLLNEAYTMGYHSIVVLLGAHPLDSWFSQHPDALLTIPKPMWPLVVSNAYVLSQHVRAAAYELPLQGDEADRWGTRELCDRLVERKQMSTLPQSLGWLASATPDAYEDFHLTSAIGLPVLLQAGEMSLDAPFDPTGFERWLGLDAGVPPWFGGVCVTERDADMGSVLLQVDALSRRTLPLRECTVTIRETKVAQSIGQGRTVTYGRVLVDEQVIGLHVWHDGTVTDEVYDTPLSRRWTAPACWLDVPQCTGDGSQLIGWSVVLGLSMLTLLDISTLVPCADTTLRRVYFVDAQPGGNGASEWMYAHGESVLHQALLLAELLIADPLLTEGCTLDESWLRNYVNTRSMPVAQRASATTAIPLPPPTAPRPTAAVETASVPTPVATPSQRGPERPPVDDTQDSGPHSVVMPNPHPASGSAVTAPQRLPAPTPRRRQHNQRSRPQVPAAKRETPDVPSSAPTRTDAAKPQTTAHEATPNINRIMANLRKQIEERLPNTTTERDAERQPRPTNPDVHRFVPGQRIFCLPYGDGVVLDSFFVNSREYIRAEFPNYGELQIDPALSLVRVVSQGDTNSDDS